MRIDCFIMNPPYNRICNKILEQLKEKYVITINGGAAIMSKCYNKVTFAEHIKFPNIVFSIGLFEMNPQKKPLFEKIYKFKSIASSNFYVSSLYREATINSLLITNKRTYAHKMYLDIDNEKEMKEINEYILSNKEKYNEWIEIYKFSQSGLPWLVPTILGNTKYAYLVEEV